MKEYIAAGNSTVLFADGDGMTKEGAVEYFEYTLASAYVGKGTPAYASVLAVF